jgi:hypothetical protein
MENKNPNNLKEFVLQNGNAPPPQLLLLVFHQLVDLVQLNLLFNLISN